jgi:hypothetical protein
MARGFVYLTAVVDVASRRVLTHKVAITMEPYWGAARLGLGSPFQSVGRTQS